MDDLNDIRLNLKSLINMENPIENISEIIQNLYSLINLPGMLKVITNQNEKNEYLKNIKD